jgi:Fic family protein
VVGDVAGRYTRLKAAVASGKCAPSLAKVRQFAGCNQDTATKYLAQMAKEGVIAAKASGRGWQVRSAA